MTDKPTWTTTPPTKPGVYVVRGESKDDEEKIFIGHIVHLSNGNEQYIYTLSLDTVRATTWLDLKIAIRDGLQILSRPLCTDIDAFVRGE